VDDVAARALFRQNPSRTFPSKDAISRFDCARQQAQSTRRMPLKAPINADNQAL
jgi:hypothetical protein